MKKTGNTDEYVINACIKLGGLAMTSIKLPVVEVSELLGRIAQITSEAEFVHAA